MIEVTLNGNTELVKELHKLIIKINDFIEHPDSDTLAELVSDDLKEHYGMQRIEETARVVIGDPVDLPVLSKKFTELFQLFNGRYFDGKLPAYTVRVVNAINAFETALIFREGKMISILASSEARMVCRLLREMGRAATTDEYGDSWNTEMNRLHFAGAPLTVYDDMQGLSADAFIAAYAAFIAACTGEPV